MAAAMPFAVFALLALVSWNRWIEPYVDTGRELMVPWRMAQGEKLYRDVHFHHGPLGPYVAAVADLALGRSLPGRMALDALVALLHLAALGRLARRLLSPWRAALAASISIAAAMFLRPGGWLFPFSFDTGIAVAALTWALVFAAEAEGHAADFWAGACLLAALLSRLELGLAGIAVLALTARRTPRRLVPLAAAPLAAAAAGYGMLSAGVPLDRLVADGWLRLIAPPTAFRSVYRAYAGLDRAGLRTTELALAAVVLALIGTLLVVAAAAATRLAAAGHHAAARLAEILPTAGLVAAAAARFAPPASLEERLALFPPLVRVIPPCLVIAAVLRLLAALRRRGPRGPFANIPDAVLWTAALFSSRLLLAAGYVGPYDAFFLPLPIVVAVVGLFRMADRAAFSAGAALPRLLTAALLVFFVFRFGVMANFYRRPGWSPVATPAGTLWLPTAVAGATGEALDELRRLPADATLAGFPETGFFNYVLGRRSPFWLEQFFPGHLDDAGERRAIGVLDRAPPAAVLYANVLAVGEGAKIFGKDYLEKLDEAVRSRYRVASVHGPAAASGPRIGDPDFFLEIRTR